MFEVSAHGATYKIEADGIVGRCAKAGNPYEPQLLEHIYEQGFDGLAVDAGAHVGNHTLWLAVVCGLDVIAFEPTEAVDTLRRNVETNDLGDRVTVEAVALGEQHGTARSVDKGRFVPEPWQSMVAQLEAGEGEVEMHPLDAYELADVAVIKADVEGMEAQVLSGGLVTIERDRPVIYAESWSKRRSRRVSEVLEPIGYEMTARINTATPVEQWEYVQ